MALTVQINGTTSGGFSNQARASWWNDYHDLLVGTMNDQPVTLNFRPGVVSTPTLSLKGDGQNPLLRAYDTDNTTVRATLDHAGNWVISGNLSAGGTLAITGASTLSGTLAVTGAVTMSSTLAVTNNATIKGGKNVVYANSGLTGKFDAVATAPGSPATGDLWMDTSTVL